MSQENADVTVFDEDAEEPVETRAFTPEEVELSQAGFAKGSTKGKLVVSRGMTLNELCR